MFLDKIDKELFSNIKILRNNTKVDCIVWLYDYDDNIKIFTNNTNDYEIIATYPFVNAIALRISQNKLYDIAKYGCIKYISSVRIAKAMMNDVRQDICINKLHSLGCFGQGVGVAIIDTGCSPHIDLVLGRNRIKKFVNILDNNHTMYDDNGHGTFITGVLCGSGLYSNGKYMGVAPLSNIYVIKALDANGEAQAVNVLNAMQWVYDHYKNYNIRVVCMSFGSTPLARNDPLITGAGALWDSGIVVVSAGGNDGPNIGSIKSPGACEKIITVGAVQKIQDEYVLASFSSRGPLYNVIKPDIVAPGVDITSISMNKDFYTKMSGTSVSTPIVAGVVCLLLCDKPYLSPNQVKYILLNSTIHLPYSVNECGSGLINAYNAFVY